MTKINTFWTKITLKNEFNPILCPKYSIFLNLINKDEWSFHFVHWNLDNFVLQLRTITFSAIIYWDFTLAQGL